MRVTREVADRVVGSKLLCVINWYDVIDGLHAGDPGHMEDEDDFITFLQEVRTYQVGEGPAARLVDEVLLENRKRHRYRPMRAKTHGYLCPIFASSINRWRSSSETIPDQVSLITNNVSTEDVAGTYNIKFYVGGKRDVGAVGVCYYSRRCSGTVSLTVTEAIDKDGDVIEKLEGSIQFGNGPVVMPKDLDRKKMANRSKNDGFDQHSEHYNWYRPNSGTLKLTECDDVAVAHHSNMVALNQDRVERIEAPGNALAFKLNSTTGNKKNGPGSGAVHEFWRDSTDQTNDEQIDLIFPD